MTLSEAIKHCEEVAEAEERMAKLHQRPDKGIKGSGKRYLSCIECANEHRQLAEWLRELQHWREFGENLGARLGEFLTEEQIRMLDEFDGGKR